MDIVERNVCDHTRAVSGVSAGAVVGLPKPLAPPQSRYIVCSAPDCYFPDGTVPKYHVPVVNIDNGRLLYVEPNSQCIVYKACATIERV